MSVHAWLYAGSAYFSFNLFIIIFFIQKFTLPQVTKIMSLAFIGIYLLTFIVDYGLLRMKPKQSPIPFLAGVWLIAAITFFVFTNEVLIGSACIGAAIFTLLFQTRNPVVNTFLTTFPPFALVVLWGFNLFYL